MDKEYLLLHSAMEANILPLTSACDAACVFCSHHANPAGIRVTSIPHRTLEEIGWTLSFLHGREKIAIGQSATSIIEGEPLCHPQFAEIISMVRKKFPGTLISLTTNGHRLDEQMVGFLQEQGEVEINLSLNSATVRGRSILMGDEGSLAAQTIRGVKLLERHQIPFHGSIVAMPHLVGWEDMAETVRYLAENGAMTVRIFMPGYAKKARPELRFDPGVMHRELVAFVEMMVPQVSCPLLLEPPAIGDLTPVVAGVIRGTRAHAAGIRRGDVLKQVNGRVPRSRVEGWSYLQQPGEICVELERNGHLLCLQWDNGEGGKYGTVMEYDFDMRRMEALERIIAACSGQVLALASELGSQVLSSVFKLMGLPGEGVEIQVVKNRLFGGSIMAAGLLSVEDFTVAVEEYCAGHERPDLLLIPGEAFDCQGYDLTGHLYWELAERTGIDVKVG